MEPLAAEQGHHVTNADLVPLGHPGVADLRVDLTDAGETYSALAGLATFDELDLPAPPRYDAVVHFAAVPRILLTSDAATYAANVSAMAAQLAVLPTTKPQPARNPHQGPSRSRP